jgi:hypothetical protein
MGKLVTWVCLAILITAIVLASNGIGWTQAQEEGGNKIRSSVPRALIRGISSCAAGFTETHRIPYARSFTGLCETVISCLNIGNNIHDVTAQFFFNFGQAQAGSDATFLDLFPGESMQLGTAAADPLGVFIMNGNAGLTGFEGYARVCTSNPSASKALACDATLVCTGGMAGLKVIIATQKGD